MAQQIGRFEMADKDTWFLQSHRVHANAALERLTGSDPKISTCRAQDPFGEDRAVASAFGNGPSQPALRIACKSAGDPSIDSVSEVRGFALLFVY
jgi:hypothetical protein